MRIVKVMMTQLSMSLFDLLKFLALFICEIGSHLPVRFGHDLMDALAGLASDNSQLRVYIVDDRRDLRDLFRCEIEFGAQLVLHPCANPIGTMQFKKLMPGV